MGSFQAQEVREGPLSQPTSVTWFFSCGMTTFLGCLGSLQGTPLSRQIITVLVLVFPGDLSGTAVKRSPLGVFMES